MNLWYNASFLNMNEVTLLLKNPGDMAFTLMLSPAGSFPSIRVNWLSPALLARYE